MDFILFIKRYFLFILFLALLGGAIGYQASMQVMKTSYKTTLFLTVANKAPAYPDQMETAGNFFAETLVGWFRNPVFTDAIISHAHVSGAAFSASKQERQNILVEIKSDSAKEAKVLADSTLITVQSAVAQYNTSTKNEFIILNQGGKTQNIQGKQVFFPIGGLILGIFFAFVLSLTKEGILGQISSVYELQNILGRKPLEILPSSPTKEDIAVLFTAVEKMLPTVLFAGVGVDAQKLLRSLALYFEAREKNLVVVDGDLEQRNLEKLFEVTSSMKLKGHTDASLPNADLIEAKVLIQQTKFSHLFFVGAGQGNQFVSRVFQKISELGKTLVYTSFPSNFEALTLENASLLLVVKLGKTKIRDLKRIRQIWEGKIMYLVLN